MFAADFDIPNEGIERRHAPFTHFSRDVRTSTSTPAWLAIEERERVHDCFDAHQPFFPAGCVGEAVEDFSPAIALSTMI